MLPHLFKTILFLCVTFFISYPLRDKVNTTKYDENEKNKNISISFIQEEWPELKNATRHLKTLQKERYFPNDSLQLQNASDLSKQKYLWDFPKYHRNTNSKPEETGSQIFQIEKIKNESEIVRQGISEKTLLSNNQFDEEDEFYSKNQDMNIKKALSETTYANILRSQINTKNNKSEGRKTEKDDTPILKAKMSNSENNKIKNQSDIIINNTNILPKVPNGILQSETNEYISQIPLISVEIPQRLPQYDSIPIYEGMTHADINLENGNIIKSKTHILNDNETYSENINKGNHADSRIIRSNDIPRQHYSILESERNDYLSKISIRDCKPKEVTQYYSVCNENHTQSSSSFKFSSVDKDTSPKALCSYYLSKMSDKTLTESPDIPQENSTSLRLPLMLDSLPQSSAFPTTNIETQQLMQLKPHVLLAITCDIKYTDKENTDRRTFSSITVGNEEIYKIEHFQEYSRWEKLSAMKRKYSDEMKYRLSTLRLDRRMARISASDKIKNKVIITFRSLKMLRILNTVHPLADIRDMFCLSKYINVIAEHSRTGDCTLEEMTYYFIGKEIQILKSSSHLANAIRRLYNRFKHKWEPEIESLIKKGKLNQTLSPFDGMYKTNWKEYETNQYTGIHCDPFEYKFFLRLKEGNKHFFTAIDIEWNESKKELSHYTKVKKSGEIKSQRNNVKINSKLYEDIRQSLLSDLTTQNCRFITVGHGILKSMIKLLGQNMTSYENVIDLQLQFYLHKNEPMNNTLNYLSKKYLHLIEPRKPDSYMRAKICMQLYRLYRFELGIDEFWYEKLMKSKKYCSK